MAEQLQADVKMAIAKLRQDHADFDAAINAMIKVDCDLLQIQRIKKKKLAIKDQLQKLEGIIIPDIMA